MEEQSIRKQTVKGWKEIRQRGLWANIWIILGWALMQVILHAIVFGLTYFALSRSMSYDDALQTAKTITIYSAIASSFGWIILYLFKPFEEAAFLYVVVGGVVGFVIEVVIIVGWVISSASEALSPTLVIAGVPILLALAVGAVVVSNFFMKRRR